MKTLLALLLLSCGQEVCTLTPTANSCCDVKTEIPYCVGQQQWTCITTGAGNEWRETGPCR
jgi:hypothetical protein